MTWSSEANTVETSDFDSDGWTSSFVVTRGATLSFEGHALVDEDTGEIVEGVTVASRVDIISVTVI